MECKEFTVLYTHQKTKKSKVWQDGILKYSLGGNKAILCDDKGQVLDSIFVKFQVKSGDDLESERYLITVETEKNLGIDGGTCQSKNIEVPTLTKKPSASSLHLPVGLKRKFTGFQGPRHVGKKMATVEEPVPVASPKCSESSFPSHFCVSSPLFSVAYQKKENTNLLPVFKGDGVMNRSDTESITSVASMPYTGNHKVVQNVGYVTGNANSEWLKPQSQLENGLVNLNYHASNSVTISQNIRSKGQIIEILKTKTALLSREQNHSRTPEHEQSASLNHLPLMKSEFHSEGLLLSEPARSADVLCQQNLSSVLGSVNSNNDESIKHKQAVHSTNKKVQTKSRWDVYLPSHVPKEPPDVNVTEQNKNMTDLQPVIKDLKESGGANRVQRHKDDKNLVQIPTSLEISISPVIESSVKKQHRSSIVIASCMNIGNDAEVVPFDSVQKSNCIDPLEAFDANVSKSKAHPAADDIEALCHLSQNIPCPVISSENISDSCTYGELDDPAKQFIQVNFNVPDIKDFSDTEDEECHADSTLSQHSVCSKALSEVSVEKISDEKTCTSEGKENMQAAFLQGSSVNHTLQFCDTTSEDVKDTTTCNFQTECSEAAFVNELVGAKTTDTQNIDACKDLDCIGRDLFKVNGVHCGVNKKGPPQTSYLRTNVMSCVHPHSNTYIMDKSNKGVEDGGNNSHLLSQPICSDLALASPLLVAEKDNSSDGLPFYTIDKHYAAPENNYNFDCRLSTHRLDCEALSDETQMHKGGLEDIIQASDAFCESSKENEKHSVTVSSSSLPNLENGFSLLRSLTEHSSALESLQMIEESATRLCQRGTLAEKQVSKGGPKGY